MAETMPVKGYPSTAKIRNPWGVLGLVIITFGIYSVFWWYFINRELRDMGRARQDNAFGENPAMSALAFSGLAGLLLYIPTVVTIVRTSQRVQHAQRTAGASETLNGGVAALLWIFTLMFGGIVYTQMQMNTVLRAGGLTGAGGPQELPSGDGFVKPGASAQPFGPGSPQPTGQPPADPS